MKILKDKIRFFVEDDEGDYFEDTTPKTPIKTGQITEPSETLGIILVKSRTFGSQSGYHSMAEI